MNKSKSSKKKNHSVHSQATLIQNKQVNQENKQQENEEKDIKRLFLNLMVN